MSEDSDIFLYSDRSLMQQIGRYVKRQRIQKGMTQEELAARAAMSRSTLSLMERGENIVLLNLIKALRVLDVLHVFSTFRTPTFISPFVIAEAERKQRKRARSKRKSDGSTPNDLGW